MRGLDGKSHPLCPTMAADPPLTSITGTVLLCAVDQLMWQCVLILLSHSKRIGVTTITYPIVSVIQVHCEAASRLEILNSPPKPRLQPHPPLHVCLVHL